MKNELLNSIQKGSKRPKNRTRSKATKSKRRMVLLLDADARRGVMERDHETCQRCGVRNGEVDSEGRPVVMQWSHIHSRRHFCLRWDEDNSMAKCDRCHCWWTNNPGLAFDWFSKKWPERWERITRVLIANPKINVKEKYQELLSTL